MKASKRSILLGTLILIILQVINLIIFWSKFDYFNVGFYIVMTIFATYALYGVPTASKPLFVCAILWSGCTLAANLFFGILQICLYWFLYSKKSSGSKKTTKTEKTEPEEPEESASINRYLKKHHSELLMSIQPILKIPFFGIPAVWHKYYIIQDQKAYLMLNSHLWGLYKNTTELCSLHRPDFVKEPLQILNLYQISIFSDESPDKPIKIMLDKNHALNVLTSLMNYISKACKENEVKRIIGETAPHPKKDKEGKKKK